MDACNIINSTFQFFNQSFLIFQLFLKLLELLLKGILKQEWFFYKINLDYKWKQKGTWQA